MCRKLIVLTVSLCLISSVGAATVDWDFENGNDHLFDFWSVYPQGLAIDDDEIAGDESLTGIGGPAGLPDAGVAWTIGKPNQFDGQKPAVEEGARIDGSGLLDYSLGTEDIPAGSSTLNTYSLNQDGDYLNAAINDQIATSPIVFLEENAVLTVWSYGGGVGTHAPEYDPDPALMYTDGSAGIVVFSAEEADMYTILATLHLSSQGTLTEYTLDLSAFPGKKVQIDVVDAFEGNYGWLAIDKIQITNARCKNAGFVANITNGETTLGFDTPQIEHLKTLGYNVIVINQNDVTSEVFTKADANALDVLIISETPSSSNTVLLSGTSTPVMHQEAYGWRREWAMCTGASVNWYEGDNTNIDIVNDTHPIIVNAGLSIGQMPFFNVPNHWTSDLVSAIAPGAEILAKITQDGDDYAIVFAIEKGEELADGTAAASRIVGLSIPGEGAYEADALTDEVWALFDAAIAWLDPPETPPTAAMVVTPGDLSAGFDQAQKDRLESLGYEVTVASGDDVKNGVFTAADAETFDVLVVSESISSSAANNLIGANVPMMHQESYGWSRHFFTQGLNKVWLNDPNGMIDIVDDTHPIIADAGLSAGLVQFFSSPGISWTTDTVASLVPGAENLAQITNSEGEAFTIIFAIEAGTELADASLAANRIVGFSIPGDAPYLASDMTDDAWALFDAAIAWLDQE